MILSERFWLSSHLPSILLSLLLHTKLLRWPRRTESYKNKGTHAIKLQWRDSTKKKSLSRHKELILNRKNIFHMITSTSFVIREQCQLIRVFPYSVFKQHLHPPLVRYRPVGTTHSDFPASWIKWDLQSSGYDAACSSRSAQRFQRGSFYLYHTGISNIGFQNRAEIFLPRKKPTLALGPIQPLFNCNWGPLRRVVKCQGRDANHFPLPNAGC